MFARKVAARLKPNSLTEFTNLLEREILPWLREQEGFLDLIIMAPTAEKSQRSASGTAKAMRTLTTQPVIRRC